MPLTLYSENTRRICAEAQRASLILENLSALSNAKEGEMQNIDLRVVLEDTLSQILFTSTMTLHKVELQKDLTADLPMIQGNSELLRLVFANLTLNACDAMPQGGKLTVTARTNKAKVEIQFSDTGKGIREYYLSKIFDPFFTTNTKGMGLGLSAVYTIVQRHQGNIRAESQEGKGASFVIAFTPCR